MHQQESNLKIKNALLLLPIPFRKSIIPLTTTTTV